MFERFSHDARDAVIAAQDVARATGSRRIDTRHLLVAIAEGTPPGRVALRNVGVDLNSLITSLQAELRSSGLDHDALATLGVDLALVRERADAVFGVGALESEVHSPGHHIPFSRDAKTALQLALRETLRLKQKTIDGRHLLLGILRKPCPGRDALTARGTDLDELRRALEQLDAPVS